MSYCRWSTDNFGCDLYCYADVRGGYTTHVAGNKAIGDVPRVDMVGLLNGSASPEEVAKQHAAQHEFLMNCERRPLGLPHDGQSFNDPDLESFLARLLSLRAAGYRFPDYVLDSVREEIEEEKFISMVMRYAHLGLDHTAQYAGNVGIA